jgi:glycosyltransferase involved in cell wall biosynthesis
MPPITALLHTANDELRLGRALEMLVPCDEILIVDHGSHDQTRHIAQTYGAKVISASAEQNLAKHLAAAKSDWILCLLPAESISESLQASLYELKLAASSSLTDAVFSVLVREETAGGWTSHALPETRLVPRSWSRWKGHLPESQSGAIPLQGEILRFSLP